ncbi:MAG: tRNA pseudouridine(38-40) synthase TruA [Clostridia bacterium]|nr:tRNA pseudouridine(38-40) synthase TruA [Clostridia bacterium]
MRYLVGIQYKGSAYCGWQRQKNGLSVQAVVIEAWRALTGETIVLHGSGRTDAGVHALCQCAHFDTQSALPVDKIPLAMNTKLPVDVRILWAREVAEDFHARFSVKAKTYRYRLYWGAHADAFAYDLAHHVVKRPNVELMKKAAEVLVGEHDFKAMQATGGHVKSTVRTIYSIDIQEEGNQISITVRGNGFLYNMVRILAGTLLYAGWEWLTAEDIAKAIEEKDRTALGKTLPAEGLYLVSVEY